MKLKTDTNELSGIPWLEAAQIYSNETKFGAAAGLGYNFDISSKFTIDVNADYSIYNLVGKKEKKNFLGEKITEENLDSIELTVSIFYKI